MGDNTISVTASAEGTTLTKVAVKEFEFEIDEPELFGGKSLAPSPVDYLLGSVAGCIVAAGTYMAKEMGFELYHLEAAVDGRINSDCFFGISSGNRSGFQEITVSLRVESSASEDQLEEWKRQLPIRCPVIDNLLHPVKLELTLNGTE